MGKRVVHGGARAGRRDAGTWFAILLFPVVFGVAGTIGLVAGGKRTLDAVASPRWPSTEGTIVYAARRSPKSVDVTIVYDYFVNGAGHRAHDYSFSSSSSRVSRNHSVGQKVAVFYKPSDPNVAVLAPGIGTSFTLPLFSLIGLLVGGWIGIALYRSGP